MEEIKRLLNADEIECRVGTIQSSWYTLLLYKDARVDMKVLDEVYGPKNWQRTHEVINNNLFCNIEIWDDDKKCWVKKQDVGTESFTEKEKGEASDSFKRAGFNWGIGRELYTSPFIFVLSNNDEIDTTKERPQIKKGFTFKVVEIKYNEKSEIIRLQINLVKKDKATPIFLYGMTPDEENEAILKTPISEERLTEIVDLIKNTNTDIKKFCEFNKIKSLNHINLGNVSQIEQSLINKKEKLENKEVNE